MTPFSDSPGNSQPTSPIDTSQAAATTGTTGAPTPATERVNAAAATDPTIQAERDHLRDARAALADMRVETYALNPDNIAVGESPVTAELGKFGLGKLRAERLASLADDPLVPPFFGRIDGDNGELHIGRRHIRNPAAEPLVIDWRAPVSTGFYRATSADPMGIRRRRRFGFSHGELTSYEDEDVSQSVGTSRLLAEEIERPRVGPMRDIVATIAPDQDEMVRADLDDNICIQGAPGTGKTAVGLHRAAYLLYSHAERLRRAGVLVVGPNRAFLGYVAAVLPALGEIDVHQVTVDELVEQVPVTAVDGPEAALIEGRRPDGRGAAAGGLSRPHQTHRADRDLAGVAAIPRARDPAAALRRRPAPRRGALRRRAGPARFPDRR